MARGKREVSAVFVAAALHGAALVPISLWASHHPQTLSSLSFARTVASPPADELEVDWFEPALAPLVFVPGAQQLPQGSPRSASLAGRAARLAARPQASSPSAAGEPARDEPLVSDAETPLPVSAPSSRVVDLGLGPEGWQRWLPDTQAAAPPSPRAARPLFRMPAPSSNGGLREGLEARDRAVSLGSAGPVVHALFDAAHGDAAPPTGVARFEVTVLKSGAVEVAVRDASGDVAGWRAVASDAAGRLRKAVPRIPNGRNGVHLLVELRAENTLPNGLKQKDLSGPHVELSPPRFRSNTEAQRILKDQNPVAGENGAPARGALAVTDLPGVYLAQRGKVCSYRIGLSALGPLLQGGCDLSNLGAKPQRMVHTRVAEETAF